MRQTTLKLSQKDRRALEEFRSKGNHMARELNRAHILSALDRKMPENRIRKVLGHHPMPRHRLRRSLGW